MGNWWESEEQLEFEKNILPKLVKFSNPLEHLDPQNTIDSAEAIGKDVALRASPKLRDLSESDSRIGKPTGNIGPIGIEHGEGGPIANPNYQSPIGDPAASRASDFQKGLDFGEKYFGEGNADMAEILATRKKRALGLNQDEIQAYRERGGAGINQQMATGMRALRGAQAGSGVRGGAAGAQAIPLVNRANQARGALERDIGIADMERRSSELTGYERSLTGERAGLLGTGAAFADMGAGDRATMLQYLLGEKAIDAYGPEAGKEIDLNIEKPWHQKATQHWQDQWDRWGLGKAFE
jgi:hypothetical protein